MDRSGDGEGDPRRTGTYVRQPSAGPDGATAGGAGSLTLVGVVHDHPASTYRVRQAIQEHSPDVLALELPPAAVSLFEQYATDGRTPPAFGGEMSAAIQAADTDRTVGIDRPARGFFRRLLRDLLRERPPISTLRGVLSNVASAVNHAVVCRLAATVAARTSVRLEVDSPIEHDADWSDPPERQAADERTRIRQSQAFLNVFQGASPTRASRFVDETRETHMADRLSALRADGDVLAVVGIDHLDPLSDLLSESP